MKSGKQGHINPLSASFLQVVFPGSCHLLGFLLRILIKDLGGGFGPRTQHKEVKLRWVAYDFLGEALRWDGSLRWVVGARWVAIMLFGAISVPHPRL